MIMSISSKVTLSDERIAFIHKRAKISERREDQQIDKAEKARRRKREK